MEFPDLSAVAVVPWSPGPAPSLPPSLRGPRGTFPVRTLSEPHHACPPHLTFPPAFWILMRSSYCVGLCSLLRLKAECF